MVNQIRDTLPKFERNGHGSYLAELDLTQTLGLQILEFGKFMKWNEMRFVRFPREPHSYIIRYLNDPLEGDGVESLWVITPPVDEIKTIYNIAPIPINEWGEFFAKAKFKEGRIVNAACEIYSKDI